MSRTVAAGLRYRIVICILFSVLMHALIRLSQSVNICELSDPILAQPARAHSSRGTLSPLVLPLHSQAYCKPCPRYDTRNCSAGTGMSVGGVQTLTSSGALPRSTKRQHGDGLRQGSPVSFSKKRTRPAGLISAPAAASSMT
jgi:hypothetical protein